jgi:hypothetical protein
MTLQPSVGPWLLFQFLDLIHSRYDSLDGGSARRKASTYTEQNKHRINAYNPDIHSLSGIRTHDPSIRENEDSPCIRARGHCDRHLRCMYVLIPLMKTKFGSLQFPIRLYLLTNFHCILFFHLHD